MEYKILISDLVYDLERKMNNLCSEPLGGWKALTVFTYGGVMVAVMEKQDV
jgi:hypothetical protein